MTDPSDLDEIRTQAIAALGTMPIHTSSAYFAARIEHDLIAHGSALANGDEDGALEALDQLLEVFLMEASVRPADGPWLRALKAYYRAADGAEAELVAGLDEEDEVAEVAPLTPRDRREIRASVRWSRNALSTTTVLIADNFLSSAPMISLLPAEDQLAGGVLLANLQLAHDGLNSAVSDLNHYGKRAHLDHQLAHTSLEDVARLLGTVSEILASRRSLALLLGLAHESDGMYEPSTAILQWEQAVTEHLTEVRSLLPADWEPLVRSEPLFPLDPGPKAILV